MGIFKSSKSSGARRETRSERIGREARLSGARDRADVARQIRNLEQAAQERNDRFWDDYERRNGPGSVDRS